MRIALIVDAYAPARTSAAVQMRDLARELAATGHRPTVIVPAQDLGSPWSLETDAGVEILRIRAPRTKDIGRLRRVLAEALLPFALWRGLARGPLAATRWDGVVWYSPTIFFGPLVRALKRRSGCRGYLILRDLFPDWAVDAGLLRKGLAYRFFKLVERYQYASADVIGVQTPANVPLLQSQADRRRVEVLNNWLSDAAAGLPPARAAAPGARRTTFVYAGNMGAAQGMDSLIDLAARLAPRDDLAFLFVGRGSETARLKQRAADLGLAQVAFRDEVEPWEVPALLAACDIGLIALDPRHTTHNIPGKFLTYLRAGLPVLAHINPGNDLAQVIEGEGVGFACTDGSVERLQGLAERLAGDEPLRAAMATRGRALSEREYSTGAAARKILAGLQPD
jgi:glycosyltransferase involved in cell wall biosynthesis